MTSKAVVGLIILTTTLFAFVNLALQAYLTAVFSFMLGSVWLILQIKKKAYPGSVFFVLFLGLAILASLHNAPIPIIVLGVSTDLAAWDLSRFQTRIISEAESDTKTLLEIKHLQNLTVTTSIGFLAALLPVFIQISLNFVVLLIIVLLIMLTLRKSILYLRNENTNNV